MFTKDWEVDVFLRFYPEYSKVLMPIVSDPEYIVRSLHDDDGILINLEFGYAGDEWLLPAPYKFVK